MSAPLILAMGIPAQHLAKVRGVNSMQKLLDEARSCRSCMEVVWNTAIMYQLRKNPALSESDEDAIEWDSLAADCQLDQSHCLYNHYAWLREKLGEFAAANMITYGKELNYQWLMRTEAKVAYEIVTYFQARQAAVLACLQYGNVELLEMLRPRGLHVAEMQAFCDLSYTDAKMVKAKASMWRFFNESQIFYALNGARDSPCGIRRAVAWHVAFSDMLREKSILRRELKSKWVESFALLPELVRTIAREKLKHKGGALSVLFDGKNHQTMLDGIKRHDLVLTHWVCDQARFLMVDHLIKEKYVEGLPKLIRFNKHSDDIISRLVELDCRDFVPVAREFMSVAHTREFVTFDRPEMFALWNPPAEFVKHIPENWRNAADFAGYKLIRSYKWTDESIAEAALCVIELDRADLLAELSECKTNILDLIACKVGFHCMEVLVRRGCRGWMFFTDDPSALAVAKAHYPSAKRSLTSSDGQEFDAGGLDVDVVLELLNKRMDSGDLTVALQIIKHDAKSLDIDAALRVLPVINKPDRLAFVRDLCYERCNCVFKWTSAPSEPTAMWPCAKFADLLGDVDERHAPYWVKPTLEKFDLVCKYVSCLQMDDLTRILRRASWVTRGNQYVDERYELKTLVLQAKRYDLYSQFCKGYLNFHTVLQKDFDEKELREIHKHMNKNQDSKEECVLLALSRGMLELATDIGGDFPMYFWVDGLDKMLEEMPGVMRKAAASVHQGEPLLEEIASLPHELMTHDFWAGAKHDGVAEVVTRRMTAKQLWAFQVKAIRCDNMPAFKAVLARGKFWNNELRVQCYQYKRKEMISFAQGIHGAGVLQYYSAAGNYVTRHPLEREFKCERPWYLLCALMGEVPSSLCVADGKVCDKEELFKREVKTGVVCSARLDLLANLFEIKNSEWMFHSFPTSDLVRRDGLTLEEIVEPQHIPEGDTYLTEAMLLECPLTGKTANTIDLSGNLLHDVGDYPFHCKAFDVRPDWTPLPLVTQCSISESPADVSNSSQMALHYEHVAEMSMHSRLVRKVRDLDCKRLDIAAALRSLHMKESSYYDVSFMDLRNIESLNGRVVTGVAFDYALMPDLVDVTFVRCSFIYTCFGKMTSCTFKDCNVDMSHERLYEVGIYHDGSGSDEDGSEED